MRETRLRKVPDVLLISTHPFSRCTTRFYSRQKRIKKVATLTPVNGLLQAPWCVFNILGMRVPDERFHGFER